jgi:hypothetical protein
MLDVNFMRDEDDERTVATAPWKLAAKATTVARDWDFMMPV